LPEDLTDEQLVARARRGDEAAFLLLYERHHAAVFRFAARLLGSRAAAEDVTHDCFLGLAARAAYDPARGTLRNYLLGAARNRAFKLLARAGRECGADEDACASLACESRGPLDSLLEAERSEAVRRAVAGLPPLQREAVVLFEYEGLSLSEIAQIAGADIGTVKSRLWRARENLRRALAPYLAPREEALAARGEGKK
jgi:RNA polymerase sigma-70 factor, ECF subfamily